MRKIFWGLFLILIASLMITSQMGIITVDLGVYQIIAALILVPLALSNLFKGDLLNTLLPLGFLFMFYKDFLSLGYISNWSVFFASLFAGIGLELIFRRRRFSINCDWDWN